MQTAETQSSSKIYALEDLATEFGLRGPYPTAIGFAEGFTETPLEAAQIPDLPIYVAHWPDFLGRDGSGPLFHESGVSTAGEAAEHLLARLSSDEEIDPRITRWLGVLDPEYMEQFEESARDGRLPALLLSEPQYGCKYGLSEGRIFDGTRRAILLAKLMLEGKPVGEITAFSSAQDPTKWLLFNLGVVIPNALAYHNRLFPRLLRQRGWI